MWKTPEEEASRQIYCRRLVFYREYVHEIDGALAELLAPAHWEEEGSITKEQALQELGDMYDTFINSEACLIGAILAYAGTLPTNVLPCDGQTYNRVDYPQLYAMLDSSLLTGPDTFITPDLRGRGIIGTGTGAGLTTRNIGDIGGAETHQLTTPELPAHTHTTHQHGADFDVEGPAGLPQVVTGLAVPSVTGSTGSDQPHNNMQPFVAYTLGIVAK